MKAGIVIPPSQAKGTGNRQTADQWAGILERLGYEVEISEGGDGFDGELLVVLHAVRCRQALTSYRQRVPGGKVVLCLTGTDIYGGAEPGLLESMREADRLVVLQRKALERVPEEWRAKTSVIVQGAERGPAVERDGCTVCVVGHLREVKDPLRAAEAVRLLPEDSRIRVVQAGAILEEEYRERVKREMEVNPRYEWVGELPAEETRELIAGSEAMVLTSRSEGGARVVGEAVVEGTPVVATRIDGVVGLLGEDYGGYFEVGATEELRDLLERLERDEEFRRSLKEQIAAAAGLFDPRREQESWAQLLREIDLG